MGEPPKMDKHVAFIIVLSSLIVFAGVVLSFLIYYRKRKSKQELLLAEYSPSEKEKLSSQQVFFYSNTMQQIKEFSATSPTVTLTKVQPSPRRTILSESAPPLNPLKENERRKTLPAISLTPALPKSPSRDNDGDILDDGTQKLSVSLNLLEIAKRRFSTVTGINLESPNSSEERRRSSVRSERFSILDNSADITEDEDPGTVALNMYGHGKICFSVSFNETKNVLYITIHKAAYLLGRKAKDSDSFFTKAELILNNDEAKHSCCTSVVTAKRKPIFEQTLPFDDVSLEVLDGAQIKLSVMKLSSKQETKRLVGFVYFRLMSIYLIENRKILQDVWRDLDKDVVDSEEKQNGRILLTLKYDKENELLTVGVIRGEDLNVDDDSFSVYVRVSLMSAERVLKVQKTRATKNDKHNPQFQEEFHYDVASNLLASLCLAAFVCTRTEQHYSHLVGKCIIGPVTYTDGHGLSHWTQMTSQENEAVEFWHNI